MSFFGNHLSETFPVTGDLSANQYFFGKLSSGKIVLSAAATDFAWPIQNKPKATGEQAEVVLAGVAKVVASGVIAVGAEVTSSASGKAAQAASGNRVLGIALEAAAADLDVIAIQVSPIGGLKP